MKKIRNKVLLICAGLVGSILLSGCQTTRPIRELALADLALRSAQKVKGDVLAADIYREAENYYLRAKKDYNDGYFDASKKFADMARIHAEKAEYMSLVKQSRLKSDSDSTEEPTEESK